MADFVKGVQVKQLTPREASRELESAEEVLEALLKRTAELGEGVQKAREEEMQRLTHCVDISLGYDQFTRSRLIGFLRKIKAEFGATSAERGMYQHENMLRVYTPKGQELGEYIREHFPGGSDFRFVVHHSEGSTRGYKKFKPDTETKSFREKFDL